MAAADTVRDGSDDMGGLVDNVAVAAVEGDRSVAVFASAIAAHAHIALASIDVPLVPLSTVAPPPISAVLALPEKMKNKRVSI